MDREEGDMVGKRRKRVGKRLEIRGRRVEMGKKERSEGEMVGKRNNSGWQVAIEEG